MRKVFFFLITISFLFPPLVSAEKKEVLPLTNTPFCANWQIEGTGSGQITLKTVKFPSLSPIEKVFSLALKKLFPSSLQKKTILPSLSLQTKGKLFGQTTGETTFTQPSWFTKLLGVSRILCSLFHFCPSPKTFSFNIEQPNLQSLSSSLSPESQCPLGKETPGEETAGGLLSSSSAAPGEVKLRGWLVGGKTLNQNAKFLESFLPPSFSAQGDFVRKTSANFSLSPGLTLKGEKAVNFSGMKFSRNFCLRQCTPLPRQIPISSLYPFCPSCSPKDYPLVETTPEDIPLDMSFCQKNPDGSCNYFDPTDHPRCDGDPICESGRCNPYQWRQAKDYTDRSCPLPYPASDCTDPSVCHLVRFPSNPNGGFGACQYTNPNVCVRADRVETGSCAAICNWACCAYQR